MSAQDFQFAWQAAALTEQLRVQEKLRPQASARALWEELGGELAAVAQTGVASVFETAAAQTRMRLFLGEFMRVLDAVEQRRAPDLLESDLLESDIYRALVQDMLHAAFVHMPSFITVPRIVDVFLHVRHGVDVLAAFVQTEPTLHAAAWTYALQSAGAVQPNLLTDLVLRMVQIDASAAWPIRRRLMQLHVLPELVLTLSGPQWCNEQLSMCAVLLAEHADWIKPHVAQMLSLAQQSLRQGDLSDAHANMLVRVCCLIVGRLGTRLDAADVALVLGRARSHAPYALAFIALIPFAVDTQQAVMDTLEALAASPSARPVLLPWALDFHASKGSDAIASINQRVRDILGVSDASKLSADETHIRWLQRTFTDTLFPKSALAQLALDVAPTDALNAAMPTPVSVTAVTGLIASGVFRSSQIDPQAWVFAQINACATPAHHAVVALVREFSRSALSRVPDRVIFAYFAGAPPAKASAAANALLLRQALVLYYVLGWNDHASAPVNSRTKTLVGAVIKPYTAEVMHKLSIRATVEAIRQARDDFGPLSNALFALAAAQFPHFFGVTSLLTNDASLATFQCYGELMLSRKTSARWLAGNGGHASTLTVSDVTATFAQCHKDYTGVKSVLEWLAVLPPTDLKPFKEALLDVLFPLLVQESTPRSVLHAFQRVWDRLTIIDPASAWSAATFRAFALPATSASAMVTPPSLETLIQNPLQIFRCNMLVFRSPPLFAMFLSCLRGLLVATRQWLSVAANRDAKQSLGVNDGQVEVLASLQETAVVQLLLEVCTPDAAGLLAQHDSACEGDWEEIAAMTCEFLHQLFIDHVDVPRFLHYQGYQHSLLPMTVNGVASMHICFDFLPDIIRQPQQSTVVFGMHLMAQLAVKYPIAKSRDVVLGALQYLHVKAKAATEPTDFWVQILPVLPQLCLAFPDLTSFAITWLQDLLDAYNQLVRANTHIQSPLQGPVDRTVQQLVDVLLQQPTAAVVQDS